MSTNLTSVIGLIASQSTTPFNPGFDISAVAALAHSLPSHSWEYGTAAEAFLELDSAVLSVFGSEPFPVLSVPPAWVAPLSYAEANIELGLDGLDDGSGAVGDPASLGVAAVMLGKTNNTYATAAQSEIDYLLNKAPRWSNGAISHRDDVPELWADFMYMAPPFIAYFAADSLNSSLLFTAYEQCLLYRQVLLFNSNSTTPSHGADPGLWSTGNGWAAAGMARVLASIIKAPVSNGTPWRASAIANLTAWIKEIIDGARKAPMDGGLLRNYLNDMSTDGHGFGEISGSALLASVAYRMVVMTPKDFPPATYVSFADGIRRTLGGKDAQGNPHITQNGTATPAVNPYGWLDTEPYTAGSPEGNNFVVLMYAAWRDCVSVGVCSA
ncbi:hypothetical protein FB45DRAFT_933493 [Roridomyces roridus]|uniref:Six-hairpin glycosidase n=1 Tax=Roridomyces roridus TaxID=1738132 RepID=A0AAD7BD08_9AGAR|nr:hypothetical protein FB45DRAFT_933493 [Roridomyces roridus]